MRTKPILKLIKSVRFHVKNHDQFKIADDIRNVINVTHHFQTVSTKMTKYPDMDISKKVVNYADDLQNLMNDYPNYPEFQPKEQKQFVHDLLTIYYFIYFDLQNKCQVKEINSTFKVAKTPAFKKKWQDAETQLRKAGNVVLDARFVSDANFTQSPDGSLIIDYLPKTTIEKTFN
ncbi:hypothetical protein [Acetilactobacillus jinshanensis]|uniref:Uncharacterized protein n=1 Tax=Acetilactobacillus jinshanensis TaxID=1720083 RepID=A0A4P6ZK98_9LACO|nr:hypothetical protein [Acetilactobacillus jinshanensis]QBP18094.1 hypothetical protein ELX58_02815 [Acetilactobacillus jinshanensis]URL60957.1 hypothetical protein HGK75_02855 [uncultured bacterium]